MADKIIEDPEGLKELTKRTSKLSIALGIVIIVILLVVSAWVWFKF